MLSDNYDASALWNFDQKSDFVELFSQKPQTHFTVENKKVFLQNFFERPFGTMTNI